MFVLLTAVIGYRMVEVVKDGERTDTQITYISRKGVRMYFKSGGEAIMTIQGDKMKAYILDTRRKTYMDMSSMASGFVGIYLSLFMRCRGAENCSLDRNVIKPTNEYRIIDGRRARKVIYYTKNLKSLIGFTNLPDSIESWFVKDWKDLVTAEKTRLEFFYRLVKLNDNPQPELLDELYEYLKSVFDRYGAPISTISPFMGRILYSRRITVKRLEIPDSLYQIPKGYKPGR
ncbi:MAG: hypothetical protein GXO39_02475 [Thermotogae bacterium]|nr:hypothetical protein [Thermotogota bacterium]